VSIKATLTFLKDNFGINKGEEEWERKEEIIAFAIKLYSYMFSEDL
jgi:hypothetical protein